MSNQAAPPAFQRGYKACNECRERKSRCIFTAPTNKPPCTRCLRTGRQCVVDPTDRRGKWSREGKNKAEQSRTASPNPSRSQPVQSSASYTEAPSLPITHDSATVAAQSDAKDAEDLQNPADALRILYCAAGQLSRASSPKVPAHTCDLVQRGYLTQSTLEELVDTFVRCYHPFYPLIATTRLAPRRIPQFAAEDPLLLAAICTIASRAALDSTLHATLWSHTQSEITKVMWGEGNTVGTVEALLLLSEWIDPTMRMNIDRDTKEPSMTWMMVGLAIRLGYLQGLDATSFDDNSKSSKQSQERRALAWTSCYWSDRSISVRVGLGFWSRGLGPHVYRRRSAFPSLEAKNQLDQVSYATALQAHLDLVQLMSNVKDTLYPSQERQTQISQRGDYARYLDDFSLSIDACELDWRAEKWPQTVRQTISFTFLYLRLYMNSFAFSATLGRLQGANAFKNGIGTLPDARFILRAIDAALQLLREFCASSSIYAITCMPVRYYTYIIYAAVFLQKAVRVGALVHQAANDSDSLIDQVVRTLRGNHPRWPYPAERYAQLLQAYCLRAKHAADDSLGTKPVIAASNAGEMSLPSSIMDDNTLWALSLENSMYGLPSLDTFLNEDFSSYINTDGVMF